MVLNKVVLDSMDDELKPLVKELNRVGIKTIGSCSGHGKAAGYIAIDLNSLVCVRIEKGSVVLDFYLKKEI